MESAITSLYFIFGTFFLHGVIILYHLIVQFFIAVFFSLLGALSLPVLQISTFLPAQRAYIIVPPDWFIFTVGVLLDGRQTLPVQTKYGSHKFNE